VSSSDRASPPTTVEIWTDPSCPWAWQTVRWLHDLIDRGLIAPTWRLFSLELNASKLDVAFQEGAARYGAALTCLASARRAGGQRGFEALYLAIGRRLHDHGEEMSEDLLREAATEADLSDLPTDAIGSPDLIDEVLTEHHAARDAGVFGVPTLSIEGAQPMYGPIVAVGADGDEGLLWWDHVRWLAAQPEFFELKRWPRPLRPGQAPGQPPPRRG
jgi:predicted DsbA family dithiol-disulfide isomerase